jgi:transposase
MVYVRALREPERQALRQEARRAVGRVAERIRMILLSSRGYSVPEIARIFECEEATVREWIRRFEAEGLPGLKDRPRRGRPLCADAAAQERLRRTVQAGPQSAGYSGGTWTVLLLQIHLIAAEGVVLSCASGSPAAGPSSRGEDAAPPGACAARPSGCRPAVPGRV